MKVKELIAELQTRDPERLVVLSRDEEGNGFQPLVALGLENCTYHDGETSLEFLTPELVRQGFAEEDIKGGEPALILWP